MKTMGLDAAPRTWRVSAAVVAAHAALLWLALHGLSTPPLSGPSEHLILASVVAEIPNMPATRPAPAPTQLTQRPHAQALPQTTAVPTAPSPVAATAAAESTPSANTANTATASTAPPSAQAPSVRTASPAVVVLPSSDADYLNNPAPVYPRMSRRMGEQGTVLVRVLISADGRAEQAEIRTSSGYARLDEAALDTVKRWRYVPGKRAGTAEAMWFNVPVRFVLD